LQKFGSRFFQLLFCYPENEYENLPNFDINLPIRSFIYRGFVVGEEVLFSRGIYRIEREV
jgi:hypothetical protein